MTFDFKKILSNLKLINNESRLNNLTLILFYFIASILVTYDIWISGGVITFKHDWSFAYSAQSTSLVDREIWYSYYDKYLGSGPTYTTSYLYLIIVSILGKIGISGAFLSKFLLTSSIFFSGLFSNFFLKKIFKIDNLICLGASLVYLSSPFLFYRAVAGHIYFLIGYALMPIFTYFIVLAFKSNNFKSLINNSLIGSFLLFVIGWQIQYFALSVPIILSVWFLVKNDWHKKLLACVIVLVLNILYSLPWLLILYFKRDVSESFKGALSFKFIEYQSKFTTLPNILQVREGFAPYFGDTLNNLHPFFQYLYYFSSILVILIVFYGIFYLIFKGDKLPSKNLSLKPFAISLSIALLVIIFLTKGVNFPFGDFNLLLFKYIPALGIFREIYNFAYVIVFAYIIFYSFALEHIDKVLNNKFKVKLKFSVSSIIICATLIGYLPIYASGNFGGLLKTYDLSYQDDIANQVKNERVLFLPNLQPYNTDKNAKWGGYDLFQAKNNFSTFSQGDAKDSFQQNYFYFVNYCLIFDENCADKLPSILRNLSFSRIVVYKDLYSLYQNVTGLGLDREESLKFKNFNYIEKINKMNLNKLYDTDKYTIFELKDPKPLISSGSKNTSIIGGIDLSNISDLNAFQNVNIFPSQRKNLAKNLNNIDNVVIKNNKIDLLDLESNINTELIEPGFFVDSTNWFSYYGFWWRKNYSDSGYNGVFTNVPNNTLDIITSVKKSDDYEIWISLGQQESNKKSKFELTIANSNFDKIVENTNDLRASGLIKLGESKINSGQNNFKLTNLEGETMIDAIFLKPKSEDKKLDMSKKSLFSLNDATSIDNEKTTSDKITTNLDDYSLSAFNPEITGTEFKKEKEGDFDKFSVEFNNNESQSEFINLRSNLKDIPIGEFRKISDYIFNYKSSSPDDVLIDFNISYKVNNEEKSIFYKRLDNLASEGSVDIDLTGLPSIVYNSLPFDSDYNDNDIKISSLNILLNKKTNKKLSNNEQVFYIKNPFFQGTKDSFIGKDGYSILVSHINPKLYYSELIDYINTLNNKDVKNIALNKFSKILFPYKSEKQKTDAEISDNLITLYPKENDKTAEFAILNLDVDNSIFDNKSIIYIPIEMNNEDSFIDVLLTGNKDGKTHSSGVLRNIPIDNQKSYVLVDLKKLEIDGNNFNRIQLIFNKKIGVSTKNALRFKVGDLSFINGYDEYYKNSLFKTKKDTFVKINVPKDQRYTFEAGFNDGSKFSNELNLNKGLNDIEIPDQSDFKSLSYTILKPKDDVNNFDNKVNNIAFKKISSTEYTFNLDSGFENLDKIFINLNIAYDPDWQLFYDGKLVGDSFRGNLIFNAFNIENPKVGTYTLKYRLQNYRIATLGLVFSLFLAQLLWFGYQYSNRKYGFSLKEFFSKLKNKN